MLASIEGFGQAVSTADRKAEISVFAGGSIVQPQPDLYKNNQTAYVFGADYTRFINRFYVNPSLEVRALISPIEEEVGEDVYSGGLKVDHKYRMIHPYGDILFGYGKIKFNQENFYYGYHDGWKDDDSVVLTYGGGADIDVWRNYGVKVDYQGSHWNTGGNVIFHPKSLNFAVVYRFRFNKR